MIESTRVPSGGHDYTAEMLAVAIAEADLHNNMGDLRALLDAAVAEHPRRVIEILANFLAVEFANEYGADAARMLDQLRWGFLDCGGRA